MLMILAKRFIFILFYGLNGRFVMHNTVELRFRYYYLTREEAGRKQAGGRNETGEEDRKEAGRRQEGGRK